MPRSAGHRRPDGHYHGPVPTSLDHDLGDSETLARTLARIWLPAVWAGRPEAVHAGELHTLLSRADAADLPRLRLLSDGFEALCRARGPLADGALEAVQDTLLRARASGWDRAVRLSEAALMHALYQHRDRHAEALALAHRQGPASDDPRPALERMWTDVSAALLQLEGQDHGQALHAALVARDLAASAKLPEAQVPALRALSFVLLSLGDVDTALSALEVELGLLRATGMKARHTVYNLGLALLLRDRPAEVLELARDEPWMLDADLLREMPAMACLQAAAHARSGNLDEARRLSGSVHMPPPGREAAVRVNMLWLTGEADVACGQAELAAARIGQFLAEDGVDDGRVSPMNATQLWRVLSDALEACGDDTGALAALRQSQAHARQWVVQSVRTRLGALLHPTVGAPAQRMAARIKLLDEQLDEFDIPRHPMPLFSPTASVAPAVAPFAAGRQPAPDDHHAARQHVAAIAHELRNPLNGVVGSVSLLMMSDLDARQHRYAALAQTSAQVLLRMCNQLLDLARMDAEQFSLDLKPHDVRQLVQDALDVHRATTQHRPQVALRIEIDPTLPAWLMLDGLRVQQIVMNLVGNAIKFTELGEVVLSLRWLPGAADERGGQLLTQVRDTGRGFDPRQAERIFDEFVQLDDARRGEGAGLGLSICRRLSEQMGGRLSASSALGRGSTFRLELPAMPVDRAAVGQAP